MDKKATEQQLVSLRALLEAIIQDAQDLDRGLLAYIEDGERWPFAQSAQTVINVLSRISGELGDLAP